MMLALKDLLHTLKDRDWDVNPVYKIDENEAKRIIEGIEGINKWIPCKVRLPQENGVYIVSYEDSVRLLEWFNGKWFFYPSNPAREETGIITAWMPLPESYKAESEGKE